MDMSENNAKMMLASAEGIGAFKPILSFGELKKGADGLVCVVVQDDDIEDMMDVLGKHLRKG